VPLEHVYERKYVMRLDQGPTASFKDFAARMMGRLMNHFLAKNKRELLYSHCYLRRYRQRHCQCILRA
jgi:threonine synthase